MAGTSAGAAKARAAREAAVAKAAADARLASRFGPPDVKQLTMAEYVVGRRALKCPDGVTRTPGEVVPGAGAWPRLESWVRAGALKAAS